MGNFSRSFLAAFVLLVLIFPFPTDCFDWFGRNSGNDEDDQVNEIGSPPSPPPVSPPDLKDVAKDVAAKVQDIIRAENEKMAKSQAKAKTMANRKSKVRKGGLARGQTMERKKSFTVVDASILEGGPSEAAKNGIEAISHKLQVRLEGMYKDAKTPECRKNIAEAFSEYLGAIGGESSLPYTDHSFTTECPRRAKEPRDNKHSNSNSTGVKLDDPKDLKILYLIMTHEKPMQTVRLISALEDLGHTFIIHVDAKKRSDETQVFLKHYYSKHPLVHVLPDEYRIGVNWGGFSVVDSTLKAIQYAFGIGRPGAPFDFHRVINVASTSYPLKSNKEIRSTLNKFPIDINFIEVRPNPNRPNAKNWHKFVECDDKVHRIYRMSTPKDIPMMVGSQWFIISREFAEYMVDGRSDFVADYIEYGRSVVVSDENFFATVFKNSPFCDKHENKNFLHMQFDDWENNKNQRHERDPTKCLMPDPDHCGRSPTTMTYDYLPVLELSTALFARKFSEDVDVEILDIIDRKRNSEDGRYAPKKPLPDGENVVIMKKDSVTGGGRPLCLTRNSDGREIRYKDCFGGATLEDGWETRMVPSSMHVPELMKWSIGPCSTDGNLTFTPGECVATGEGRFSKIGPTCAIMGATNSDHEEMCLDVEGENMTPGGDFLMYTCTGRWNQYFSFGGSSTLDCSIHLNIPKHLIDSKNRKNETKQVKHLCMNAGNQNGKVKTSNCVPGDDSDEEKKEWMEQGNEWIVMRFEDGGRIDKKKGVGGGEGGGGGGDGRGGVGEL